MSLLNGGLKLSALLHKVLTVKQAKQIHAKLLVDDLSHLEPVLIRQIILSAGSYRLSTNKYVDSLLHHLQYPDVVPLSYTIRCLSQQNQSEDVIDLYVQLHKVGVHPNTYALSSTLKACGKLHRCKLGVSVHGQVHKYGLSEIVFVETSLMDFYSKVGDVKTAHKIFDNMDNKNVVSWNSILAGYVKHGDLPMAQSVFDEMPEKDIISWNSMVSGYSKGGIMDQAYALFHQMPYRDSASWNAMIVGYIENGKIELARGFFEAMPVKSHVSFITMISGYSKSGTVSSAKELFDQVEEKNVHLYNSMIACYAQNGWAKEALDLFDEMLQHARPDKMTLASVLSACSQLGDLKTSSRVESYMDKAGIRMDDHLATTLIDLHAKHGSMDKAFQLFHHLKNKDVVAYTAMISGCGINGRESDAIKLFEEMIDSNITPNLVTIVGALTAYNNAGLVSEGYKCFTSLKKHGIDPSNDHYAIMVELLGKAGRLEEAYELIKQMPMQPHSGVWGALLLGCSVHSNVEIGEIAASRCIELEPDSTGYTSLLANIYASVGKWDEAKRLRDEADGRGFLKVPGSSWMGESLVQKNIRL